MLALITLALLFLVIFADGYAWMRYGVEQTISYQVREKTKGNPIVAWGIGFLFGFLTAHFYF